MKKKNFIFLSMIIALILLFSILPVSANEGSTTPNYFLSNILDATFSFLRITGNIVGGCTDNDSDRYSPEGGICGLVDCNDNNAAIHPGANDPCDGIDQNCDGLPETDNDGDGYMTCNGDCNDSNPAIHPGAIEVCDTLDNNCDGNIDEGVQTIFYRDSDNDTFGGPEFYVFACVAPPGYVPWKGLDCDDNNPNIYPGAPEICNGLDDDCDTRIDEGIVCCVDADHDGYNASASVPKCGPTDCDDNNASINPGANDSLCNGIDENCNGVADEGYVPTPTTCGADLCFNKGILDCINGRIINTCAPKPNVTVYQDADHDGYGNSLITQQVCTLPSGYVLIKGDCNDNNSAIHPGAIEICNGIDDNCNGLTDESSECSHSLSNKQNALSLLETLSSSNSQSRNEIKEAIKKLTESLGNQAIGGDKQIIWLDSTHIACKYGHKVFDDEKNAVEHLENIKDSAIKSIVNQIISTIVKADRSLALTAINEAPSGKDKDKAAEKFNKGESETRNNRKIEYYREAWKYANKYCGAQAKLSCIEEMTVQSPSGNAITLIGDEIGNPDTTFEDGSSKIVIQTSCSKCLGVGQIIKGWKILEIKEYPNKIGTLAAVCKR